MVLLTSVSILKKNPDDERRDDMVPPSVPIERSGAECTDEELCECRDGPIVALVAAVLMSLGGYSSCLLSYLYFGWPWWMIISAFIPGAFFVGLLFYTLRLLTHYTRRRN